MLSNLFTGSVTSTCLIGVVAGLVVYWLIQKWKYKYPPGPIALPIVGNLLQVDTKRIYEQAYEWSKKYGPVITVRLGTMKVVFVNSIETAMEVLVKKSTDFAGRMSTPSVDVMTFGGKDIVFSNYGPTWKLHRKLAVKALRHYMQGEALQQRVHDAMGKTFVELDTTIPGEFDPADYINFIVVNILTGLCFGGEYQFGDKELKNIIETEDRFAEKFGSGTLEDFIPGLRYIYKSASFKALEQMMADDKLFQTKLAVIEKTFDRNNIRHFTDDLLLARLELAEEEGQESVSVLTNDYILQTLMDIFSAGIDTSRFTLRNVILHMIAFPDIQEKVQEEIDRVVGKDRLPEMTDRSELSYTEAVLHESMRLSTVVPMGVWHMTLKDAEVGGYRIPKGTNVAVNQWALHHDPDAWEEVDRFIPERYLGDNGKMGPKPTNWLPFSAGKRVCLGEFVAKPELHIIFACLMQRYKWKMLPGKCPDLTLEGGGFTQAAKPYKVTIERRI